MTFDDTLEQIGGFGLYQIFMVVTWNVFYCGNGWQYSLTNFIAGKMDHWCAVPELANLNETMQKFISIPETQNSFGDTVYDKCTMFDYNYSAIDWGNADLVNGWTRDVNASRISCRNGWRYNRDTFETTVVSEYDLVCDRDWMFTLPATFQMLGLFFGAFLSGAISDRFGRKRATLGLLVLSLGAIVGGAFAENFWLFVILRMFSTMFSIGAFTPLWVLTIEIMSPKSRARCLFYAHLFRVMRGVTSTIGAYYVRNHKQLQLLSAIVVLPGLVLIVLTFESPRWLISKGRLRDAEDICGKIAKINRVKAKENFTLKDTVDTKKDDSDVSDTKQASIIDLFRTPVIRKRTILIWIQWFAIVFGSYAMSLNVGTIIPGNIYLNNLLIGSLTEIPSVFFMLLALSKLGRKTILSYFLITNAIFSLVIIPLLLTRITALITTAAVCGTIVINIVFRVIYLYSSEIFPTPARSVGLGSGSSFGRIGGLISPQVPLLGRIWYGLPYIVLGFFPLVAGLLAFLLPETKGKCLPETLQEAELFGSSSSDCDDIVDAEGAKREKIDEVSFISGKTISDTGTTLDVYNGSTNSTAEERLTYRLDTTLL
ncbi:unnamed protein product [Owenia fusiformis]|uniref:Uncharacterized protein n=1 Tax=Owenia fusiformis TaxID=6347 RepID=A0A8J1TJY1_OWEFU|nr:unnamed protein product [Owenia fusiformis]